MTGISHDSETPAAGQQVITACAFIHKIIDGEERVFLAKRADSKKFMAGAYEMPGGHIEYNENPVEGLMREIDEELGTKVEVGDPFFVFTYTNETKQSHSIEVVYFAKFVSDESAIELHPEDHSTFGWFAENELVNAATDVKGIDDIEFTAMRKGFALLKGDPLRF